jgi:hypothetical protein
LTETPAELLGRRDHRVKAADGDVRNPTPPAALDRPEPRSYAPLDLNNQYG